MADAGEYGRIRMFGHSSVGKPSVREGHDSGPSPFAQDDRAMELDRLPTPKSMSKFIAIDVL